MKDKIVVVGSLNYDIILKSSRRPERGETMTVDSASFSAGGKGANQAVQAAKLGAPTHMVGRVGDDPQGGYLIDAAASYGVDVENIRVAPGVPSGMGVVSALDDGSVYASIVRGANYEVTKGDIDAAASLLRDADTVILQLEIPVETTMYAIEKAKEYGSKVLLNAAPAMEVPERYLRMCDIIAVNEVEAAFYLGSETNTVDEAKKGAEELARRYDAKIIITLGKAGAVVCDGESTEFIPAMRVDAIETTGAGDSFIGAVAYALMNGMELTEACRFATRCSAVTVCRLGAQGSMPTLSEIEEAT